MSNFLSTSLLSKFLSSVLLSQTEELTELVTNLWVEQYSNTSAILYRFHKVSPQHLA